MGHKFACAFREEEKPAGSIFMCMRYHAHSEEADAIQDLKTRVRLVASG